MTLLSQHMDSNSTMKVRKCLYVFVFVSEGWFVRLRLSADLYSSEKRIMHLETHLKICRVNFHCISQVIPTTETLLSHIYDIRQLVNVPFPLRCLKHLMRERCREMVPEGTWPTPSVVQAPPLTLSL